jgi:hypothetical protein
MALGAGRRLGRRAQPWAAGEKHQKRGRGLVSQSAFVNTNQSISSETDRRGSLWRHEREVRSFRRRIPYIQHRGGPPGFLHVLDDKTIAFADFVGNRQYITTGNLAENSKAHLFLIDYAQRRRIKIWGEARVVEDDAELIAKLMPKNYKARAGQVILFTVSAWDANCPQHIPQRFP